MGLNDGIQIGRNFRPGLIGMIRCKPVGQWNNEQGEEEGQNELAYTPTSG